MARVTCPAIPMITSSPPPYSEFRHQRVAIVVPAPPTTFPVPRARKQENQSKKNCPGGYHLDAANIEIFSWLVRNGTDVAIALPPPSVPAGGPNGPGWRRGRNVRAPCTNGAAISGHGAYLSRSPPGTPGSYSLQLSPAWVPLHYPADAKYIRVPLYDYLGYNLT